MGAPDRLLGERPELSALIDNMPDEDRGRFVRRVVEQIAELTGVANDCRTTDDLNKLVERLDEQAWDLQDTGDSVEYERAFGRARSANAWLIASSADSVATCHEAIYEALHAAKAGDIDLARLLGS